jgi:hypothetical protein
VIDILKSFFMIYIFQFSCFFLSTAVLFLVFAAVCRDRRYSFYGSFFISLVFFFLSLSDVHQQIGFVRYFGLNWRSQTNVIINSYDVLSRFLGLSFGLIFASFISYLIGMYRSTKAGSNKYVEN